MANLTSKHSQLQHCHHLLLVLPLIYLASVLATALPACISTFLISLTCTLLSPLLLSIAPFASPLLHHTHAHISAITSLLRRSRPLIHISSSTLYLYLTSELATVEQD